MDGFEAFCGGPVWDLNLTWNTVHPDFTPCFEDTVLVLLECGVLWFAVPFYLCGMMYTRSRPLARSKLYYGKMILALCLVVVSTMNLIWGSMDYCSNLQPYPALVISPTVQIATFMLVCLLIEMERRVGFITSGVLFLFYFVLFMSGIVKLNSIILHAVQSGRIDDVFHFTTFVLYYMFVVSELILLGFSDARPRVFSSDTDRNPCPEVDSSFISRVTYHWVQSLVVLGYKKSLEESDVWLPNPRDLTRNSAPALEKFWMHEMKKAGLWKSSDVETNESTPILNGFSRHGSIEEVGIEVKKPSRSPSFLWALVRVFGPSLAEAHFCKLIADVLTFIGPALQSLLIDYTTNPSVEQWKGYFYAAMLFVSATLTSCLYQQNLQLGNTAGIRVKAAAISLIYKKSLTMSNDARRTTTIGEIVNLMAVDAERLQEVAQYLWIAWSAPFQIGIAVALLYGILGVAVFAGLGTMLIMFPINGLLATLETRLQVKVMALKDQRIKLMTELLNGMKVLKLQAWELSFTEKVQKIRDQELKMLRIVAYLQAVGTFTWTCAPFLVTLASFATYVLMGGILDAAKTFTSLSLFNILRFPISLLPIMVSYLVASVVSVKRIGKFLQTTDIDTENVNHDNNSDYSVVIENGTFSWGTEKDDVPVLRNINISIPDGCLTAVVGLVGAGKSSLISAILGEMEKTNGKVNVKGSVAYVAQQAWLQNMTLRDNILFGQPFDEERYDTVLDACALRPDLDILPAGDMTEIGEKGINLSGGQKQRISLARAVYQDSDIYLLDDPLSAVDSLVGKHLFEQVIGDSGLLKNKTRILVTHGLQYLPMVDNIVVLLDGSVSETGSYDDLLSHDGPFAQFLKTYLLDDEDEDSEVEMAKTAILLRIDSLTEDGAFTSEPSVTQSSKEGKVRLRKPRSTRSSVSQTAEQMGKDDKDVVNLRPDKLIQEEELEEGKVKWSVFLSYARALGYTMVVLLLIAYVLFEASALFSNIWLSKWTEDADLQNASISNTTFFKDKTYSYLGVYGGLGILQTLFALMNALIMANSSIRASRNLHNNMLVSIMRCPLSFFDTTPIGRIINRFSRDIETIDSIIPENIQSWTITLFGVISTVIILCYSTPLFLAVALPIGILYYVIQAFYISTSRQLKRISSLTRSPIYVHFSETVSGASTIRAYGAARRFVEHSEETVDYNLGYVYAAFVSNRWLGFRLEFLGAVIVIVAALFAVMGRGTISGGIVGLSISYALQVTSELNWLVRMSTDLETNMVAVERVEEYTAVPSEGEWNIRETAPRANWPLLGNVVFDQYATRYRQGLDLVLRNISVTIGAGEKIGIVGRTGAGKSSLTLALFRIIEATYGDIVIDDINISTLGLHQLRSRLTILPQDPVLFSGTLRMNLDPVDRYTDDELWQALANAHLSSFVRNLSAGLNYECGEGGHNLSVGQRQLVCLARTLLRKTKVLILDEATAAVDLETDELIQRTIRTEFADCTVITIAHRLNTIMDCDRVLVLDVGEVKEFDSPGALLQRPDSIFSTMAHDAGITRE